jgi:hypothetical protein
MALFIAQPWDTPLSISSLIKYISILVVVVVAVRQRLSTTLSVPSSIRQVVVIAIAVRVLAALRLS